MLCYQILIFLYSDQMLNLIVIQTSHQRMHLYLNSFTLRRISKI